MLSSYYVSSSTKIQRKLKPQIQTELTPFSVYADCYPLKLPANIKNAVMSFNDKKFDGLNLDVFNFSDEDEIQSVSLEQLKQQFIQLDLMLAHKDLLQKKERDQTCLLLEKYKLLIMEAIWHHMQKRYMHTKDEAKKEEHESRFLSKMLYRGLAVGGGLSAVADGVVAGATMFLGLPAYIMLPLVLLAAYVNTKIYLAVEISSLKEELGVDHDDHVEEFSQIKKEQIKLAKNMNTCLLTSDVSIMNDHHFHDYADVTKTIHQSISRQSKTAEPYKEKWYNKYRRWTLGGVGAAIMGAFAYFSVEEAFIGLILIVGAAATPPGWVIFGVSIFAAVSAAVAYVLAVQGLGLYEAFNSKAKELKQTKKAFDSYQHEFGNFEESLNLKIINRDLQSIRELYQKLDGELRVYSSHKNVITLNDLKDVDKLLLDISMKYKKLHQFIDKNNIKEDRNGDVFEQMRVLDRKIHLLQQARKQLIATVPERHPSSIPKARALGMNAPVCDMKESKSYQARQRQRTL